MLDPKRIHLGCGERRLPGFTNVDARQTEAVDMICDMLSLPFKPESLEVVYMCHSLEHIPLLEVQPFLDGIYRLLSPKGSLYISVPDFNVLASLYLAGRAPLSMIVRAIHGGQEYPGNTHYVSYDNQMLSDFLGLSKFSEIKEYSPINFLPLGFQDTSTYSIAGKLISLNIVATK